MAEVNEKLARAVYDTVLKTLDSHQWKYTANESDLTVKTGFRGEDMSHDLFFYIQPKADVVRVSSSLPFSAKKEKISVIAEAIIRINAKMLVGSIDLDWDDGQITFGISSLYTNSIISTDLIKDMIGFIISSIEKYDDKLMAINMGYATPADIFKQ